MIQEGTLAHHSCLHKWQATNDSENRKVPGNSDRCPGTDLKILGQLLHAKHHQKWLQGSFPLDTIKWFCYTATPANTWEQYRVLRAYYCLETRNQHRLQYLFFVVATDSRNFEHSCLLCLQLFLPVVRTINRAAPCWWDFWNDVEIGRNTLATRHVSNSLKYHSSPSTYQRCWNHGSSYSIHQQSSDQGRDLCG